MDMPDKDGLGALAQTLSGKLKQYIDDRRVLEEKWLKNLLQYRGLYDKEVLDKIGPLRSKAYPRDTRSKIKAFVAKMLEMMFPVAEENWDLVLSPYPTLPMEDIDAVIGLLMQRKREAGDPNPQLTDEEIEAGIRQLAEERRYKMRQKIRDQLFDEETNWVKVAKRAIRSGAIYGIGVVKAPLVRTKEDRTWEYDTTLMTYRAAQKTEDVPYLEYCRIWDIYPDLSADAWQSQEGIFERIVCTRATLGDLRDRPGFKADVITDYMKNNRDGNYTIRSYESELNSVSNAVSPEASKKRKRFEVFRWYGFCSADELTAAGVEVPEEKSGDAMLTEVWMLGDKIIFADLAPFGTNVSDVYHAYIYAEDEEAGLTGVGMADEHRDRQMSICAATRAMYDNMASSCGPMFEVAVDLLKRNSDWKSIHSFKVFEREGEGPDLQYPAVRPIRADSHVGEILSILQDERKQFDMESNMPSWMTGNAQPLGEAFRTSTNMSMMAGGANMLTKDSVRGFDDFTSSVVRAFLDWNMEFLDDEDLKCDFHVQAKGTVSLVAKEVRGAALDQFMMTLTEEERALFKPRETLIERMKARDLPLDILVTPEEADSILADLREMKRQQQQGAQEAEATKIRKVAAEAAVKEIEAQQKAEGGELVTAEKMAGVYERMAKAKATEDKLEVDTMKAMAEQMARREEL